MTTQTANSVPTRTNRAKPLFTCDHAFPKISQPTVLVMASKATHNQPSQLVCAQLPKNSENWKRVHSGPVVDAFHGLVEDPLGILSRLIPHIRWLSWLLRSQTTTQEQEAPQRGIWQTANNGACLPHKETDAWAKSPKVPQLHCAPKVTVSKTSNNRRCAIQ